MEEPERTILESSSVLMKQTGKKKRRKFSYKVHVSSHDRSLRSRNASYNSSQLHKSSLRANNRALARAVQQLKEEYRALYERYLDSLSEQQRLLMNISELQGQFKMYKEGEKWTANKYQRIREALNEVSNNLMNTVKPLSEALDMCGETSTSYQLEKDRDTTMTNSSTLTENMLSGDTQLSAPESTLQPSPLQQAVVMEKVPLKRTAFDMSVIMEQSCIENEVESPEEMTLQLISTGGSSEIVDKISEEVSASDIDLPVRFTQSPHNVRRSSIFKGTGVRKSIPRRVSFEDAPKVCSQLSLPKEIEKNKAVPTIRRETFLLPSGSAPVLTASPRRSMRRNSSKAIRPPCSTHLLPVIETAYEPLQATAEKQDNRRETFVVTASKQTSQWPSPSSTEKAFGGKRLNILPVSDVVNSDTRATVELVSKFGLELQESATIGPVPFVNSSAHCNLPTTEQFPPVVNGIDFLDNSQLFESEDQTCLMIHTMELTEAFSSEIEVLPPCVATGQSLQNSDPTISDGAPIEVEIMGEKNGIVQNSSVESCKPLAEEVEGNCNKGSSNATEGTADNHPTAMQSELRGEDFHNTSGKTKTKTFSIKKSRVPKLIKPSHSFFSNKKIKKARMKKNKVKPKEIGEAVQVLAKTILETNSDQYSFCETPPTRSESTLANLDMPDRQILANDPVTTFKKNSEMADEGKCLESSKKEIEAHNNPLLSPAASSPAVVNESDDTELSRGCIASQKEKAPIIFSDLSDDSKSEDEDDTWVPPGKKTKSKSKQKKDSSKANDVYKRKSRTTDTNHCLDNCRDSLPHETRNFRKSTAAHVSRKSKVNGMETDDKDFGDGNDEPTISRVRTKSGKRRTTQKKSNFEIDREAHMELLEVSSDKLLDNDKDSEVARCLPSQKTKTKSFSSQSKSKHNPKEMDDFEDSVFDNKDESRVNCRSLSESYEHNSEASETSVPKNSIISEPSFHGTFSNNCEVACSKNNKPVESVVSNVENPMLDSVSSLQNEQKKEAAIKTVERKRLKSKLKNVVEKQNRTDGSECIILKSSDAIQSTDGVLKTRVEDVSTDFSKDGEKTVKKAVNNRTSVAESEARKSKQRPLKERCDNTAVLTEIVELVKDSPVLKQYCSSNGLQSPSLPKILHSSNSENSVKKKKERRPKANGYPESGKENDAMKNKMASRKETNHEFTSKMSSNENLSPTALTLQKAKRQLVKHIHQTKRSESRSPSAEKRKWNVLATDSEDEQDKECPESKAVNGVEEGRKSRRATAHVSYKEPGIGRKLRQGDPYTDTMFLASQKGQKTKKST